MKLTSIQKAAILRSKPKYDYCIRDSKKTMECLVNKGLARYTAGYGYKFGEIIELTEEGKKIRNKYKGKVIK